MSRCLAYARRLQSRAQVSFFSLASAVEFIEEMGFEADYFISPFWSNNSNKDWNAELSLRFGLFLEHIQPDIVVFDGTWPYGGFLSACAAYAKNNKKPKLVWSYRGLFKQGIKKCPIREKKFNLIIKPGEVGEIYSEQILSSSSKKIFTPPVTLLDNKDILDKNSARHALNFHTINETTSLKNKNHSTQKHVLFSLGPGNLKNVHDLSQRLINTFTAQGYIIHFAYAPISVNDVLLPTGVLPLSMYPLVKYMRAFDVFVGAAGYNTCCEVLQLGIPTLFIPNALVADDQKQRANLVAKHRPVLISSCENDIELENIIKKLSILAPDTSPLNIAMDGAECAAKAILALTSDNTQINLTKKIARNKENFYNKVPTSKLANKKENLAYSLKDLANAPPWDFIIRNELMPQGLKWYFLRIFMRSRTKIMHIAHRHTHFEKRFWQKDLKHAPRNKAQHSLVLYSEGMEKNTQRTICNKILKFFHDFPQFVPVLMTDIADFAYYSRLHILVEYLPALTCKKETIYKQKKKQYLAWLYRDTVFLDLQANMNFVTLEKTLYNISTLKSTN